MSDQLYREAKLAAWNSDSEAVKIWVVPVEPDYAAAAEERDRQLRANVLDVTAIVDAALKGNTLPASMLNVDGVTWGLDDEDEYIEVAVVPHVEADDE